MLFQQESPHWLIRQGREDEARQVLRRLRDDGDIDAEISEVREIVSARAGCRELALAEGAAAAHGGRHAGGVPADHRHQHGHLLRADPARRARDSATRRALLANVVNGVVNVGMTIVAIWLLDQVGPASAAAVRHGGHGGRHGDHRVLLPSAARSCMARWRSSRCSACSSTPGRSRSGSGRSSGC